MMDWSKVIRNEAELAREWTCPMTGALGRIASFAPYFDSQRTAVHVLELPPGAWSSIPHAESDEEEFVYLLEGEAIAWLNGRGFTLRAGDCIGFPAGEGLVHAIQASAKSCRLLMMGERTRPTNQWIYPFHLDRRAETGDSWWANWPKQSLGPELAADWSHRILHAPSASRETPWSYPGSDEVFGLGARLTSRLGLQRLGIWHEVHPPGRRSSWPHAHTHEEEWLVMLSGEVEVFLHGWTRSIARGDVVHFKPGTGLAHCVINNSGADAEYVVLGETADFPDEKIWYPLNEARNEEMRARGALWELRPDPGVAWGPAEGAARFRP
jgi:uncharacterized cupin superfamily protein